MIRIRHPKPPGQLLNYSLRQKIDKINLYRKSHPNKQKREEKPHLYQSIFVVDIKSLDIDMVFGISDKAHGHNCNHLAQKMYNESLGSPHTRDSYFNSNFKLSNMCNELHLDPFEHHLHLAVACR